jgi:hypothetical protein
VQQIGQKDDDRDLHFPSMILSFVHFVSDDLSQIFVAPQPDRVWPWTSSALVFGSSPLRS